MIKSHLVEWALRSLASAALNAGALLNEAADRVRQ